jgi:hypothetical protein
MEYDPVFCLQWGTWPKKGLPIHEKNLRRMRAKPLPFRIKEATIRCEEFSKYVKGGQETKKKDAQTQAP